MNFPNTVVIFKHNTSYLLHLNPCILATGLHHIILCHFDTGYHSVICKVIHVVSNRFSETVKIMVTLSILFSYGLQFCVPSEIAWARLEPWLRKTINYSVDDEGIVSKSVGWMYYVMRASMILVTCTYITHTLRR